MFCGEGKQAVEEAVHPELRQFARKRQREKSGDWLSTHGGDIAEAARQATMADRVRRVPFAAEVNPFQGEVGGHEGVLSPGQLEDSRIVANAANY